MNINFTLHTHYIVLIIYFSISTFLVYIFRISNIAFKIISFIIILLFLTSLNETRNNEINTASALGVAFSCRDYFTLRNFNLFQTLQRFFNFIIESTIKQPFSLFRKTTISFLYYFVLFLKYAYIYISNSFTWFYNLICKIFKINYRFYYVHEEIPPKKQPYTTSGRTNYTSSRGNGRDGAKSTSKPQGGGGYWKAKEEQQRQAKERIEAELRETRAKLREAREKAKKDQEDLKKRKGSTPDTRTPNEILGLGKSFTSDELKTAYRKASDKFHPDKLQYFSDDFIKEATEEFHKINDAYQKLLATLN